MASLLEILLLIIAMACAIGEAPEPPPVGVEAPEPPLVGVDAPLIVVEAGSSPAVAVGERVFEVEVAFTSEARQRGLSGRDSLADSAGMLFVFESGQTSSFWMKGMRIPLDFIWIGDECTVVDVHTDVPPPSSSAADATLDILRSAVPSRYTLEVNAGDVAELGIAEGDRVVFSGFSGEGALC